ncbi:hypothetical protein HZB94_04440 [Candidatus Falkowbacteria bacterium]|nr:hypothetical protein [Candidatus Falkowbacteria bacterium]
MADKISVEIRDGKAKFDFDFPNDAGRRRCRAQALFVRALLGKMGLNLEVESSEPRPAKEAEVANVRQAQRT